MSYTNCFVKKRSLVHFISLCVTAVLPDDDQNNQPYHTVMNKVNIHISQCCVGQKVIRH